MQAVASAVESNVSRRRVLGSALTLGAGTAIGATLSFPAVGVPLASTARGDLVHEELIRQLKEGVRALRGARPGEAARTVAATLRVLAAHYQATGVDQDFKSGLRAAIARDGRDAVLRWETDAAMFAAEARNFGVAVPVAPEPLNLAQRERVLDGMLENGCTLVLLAAAAELARRAPQLDRVAVAPAGARQCPDGGRMLLTAGYVTAVACLINPTFCRGFLGALLALKAGLHFAGC